MSTAQLTLDPRLDLRAATPLATAILAHEGEDLALDAAGVEQIGALALQVIRAAAQSWSAAGCTLSFENASTDLVDQLSLLGFSPSTLTTWEGAA